MNSNISYTTSKYLNESTDTIQASSEMMNNKKALQKQKIKFESVMRKHGVNTKEFGKQAHRIGKKSVSGNIKEGFSVNEADAMASMMGNKMISGFYTWMKKIISETSITKITIGLILACIGFFFILAIEGALVVLIPMIITSATAGYWISLFIQAFIVFPFVSDISQYVAVKFKAGNEFVILFNFAFFFNTIRGIMAKGLARALPSFKSFSEKISKDLIASAKSGWVKISTGKVFTGGILGAVSVSDVKMMKTGRELGLVASTIINTLKGIMSAPFSMKIKDLTVPIIIKNI